MNVLRTLRQIAVMAFAVTLSAWTSLAASMQSLPVDQIQPGMVGEGRTVFSGETVEPFKVTIKGVLRNFGPKKNLILAELEGGPLAETGVIAGMSGSPVFIDGKLIGAVAYSFPFSKEPIAGITPIDEMVEATETPGERRTAARLDFPLTPEKLSAVSPHPPRPIPVQGTSLVGVDGLKPYLGKLLAPIATPASLHGFSLESFEHIAPLMRSLGLEPLLGGAATPAVQATARSNESSSADTKLEDGGSIGVSLVRGDLDISAVGTLTHVDEETQSVYAFGHPLFNLGPIEYPMTRASVHLVLPSLMNSFKLASSGPVVGTWVQDRNTAIKGVLGTKPRMIPLSVDLKTSRNQDRSYQLEIVNDELFSPVLTYVSLISILQASEREFGSQTVKVSAWIEMENDRRVHIEDVFADQQSTLAASAMVAAPISYLMTNDFEKIRLRDIRVAIEAKETLQTAQLVRAWLDSDRVSPGGMLTLKLLLRGYRGEEMLRTVDVEVPENVGEGTLRLLVADAATVSSLERRQTQAQFVPRSLDQLVRALNNLRRNNRLYVRLSRPDQGGAIVAGEYLSSLPPSVMNVLKADQSSASYIPIQSSTLWEHELVTDYSITGSRVLEITVRNP